MPSASIWVPGWGIEGPTGEEMAALHSLPGFLHLEDRITDYNGTLVVSGKIDQGHLRELESAYTLAKVKRVLYITELTRTNNSAKWHSMQAMITARQNSNYPTGLGLIGIPVTLAKEPFFSLPFIRYPERLWVPLNAPVLEEFIVKSNFAYRELVEEGSRPALLYYKL